MKTQENGRSGMNRALAGMLLLLVLVILPAGFLWGTTVPLGIPGEWTWERGEFDEDGPWKFVIITVSAAIFVGFVALGTRSLRLAPGFAKECGWVLGLWIASGYWLWQVQECAPVPQTFSKGPFVLFYPAMSGYFHRVRYHDPAPRPFLKSYEKLMQEGDVLHLGTHPPGLFLFFHGVIALSEQPAAQTFWAITQSQSFDETNDIIEGHSQETGKPFARNDRVALWLAAVIALMLAAGTSVPIYWTLRTWNDRASAFALAALWPTIPTVAIFLPKSDAAFPCLAAWMLYIAIKAGSRRSWSLPVLYGTMVWLGLFFTLAYLPIVLATGLIFCWQICLKPASFSERFRVLGTRIAMMLIGFAVPIFLMWHFFEINLLNVWRWNYRNHAGFYEHYPRTYWKWLLINPLELGFSVGWPLFILALTGLLERMGRSDRNWFGTSLITVGVWSLLWLTGKNSGEAARLWIPLMPWVLLLTGPAIARFTPDQSTDSNDTPFWRRFEIQLLIAQLAISWLTVAGVSGYHKP